ncbi:DinB family protein [Streptomyces sp. NPDC051940]|uniref:DinB family protein n=1 Tax=Streptomyces sp. NPDC051940 TaxID=3155675 RepID=UPI0034468492
MITPDTKDWTWVLDRPCPECGYHGAAVGHDDVAGLLRRSAAAWREVLAGDPAALRTRPREDTWSPLEYAAHVRDVFGVYDERLALMLTQDGPHYPNWDQDATAVEDDYNAQDPAAVSAELARRAAKLADAFDEVEGDQWQRTGFRGDGAAFTVDSFARYFIHDPLHHLHDVDRPLAL